MSASWAGGVQSDMSPASYWSGDGTQDMSWVGMNPFFPTWCPMMPHQMAMWQAGGMSQGAASKQSRARTDSDVGLHSMSQTHNGSVGDMGRSRTLSDINDAQAVGEEFG